MVDRPDLQHGLNRVEGVDNVDGYSGVNGYVVNNS